MKNLIYLESVGYYFNPKTKMLSPTKAFFHIGSFHITNCSRKLNKELSKQDLKTIYIDQIKDV
tara:strand:- start:133 stop:321 length:189 start_codon:yes stop_codon:yes gene_type:complete